MFLKLFFTCTAVGIGLFLLYKRYKCNKLKKMAEEYFGKHDLNWKPKKRDEIVKDFKNQYFDILIVGGGSSGVGCAIDAVARGFTVGLLESNDFGSGTSSKSTKLLHGGVRYLEKAVNDLDSSQFNLVAEALTERSVVMKTCPFLSRPVDILFPLYKKILVPYYYILLKIYDWISGNRTLGKSKFLFRNDTISKFPNIRKKKLVGSISYFDGQFYDSKFNVLLAVTAAYHGASVLNHTKLVKILKENNKVIGIVCHDKLARQDFNVKCKVLINTTGPLTDVIRNISSGSSQPILQQSYGTHIVVPAIFSPKNMGFVDPNTSDGRIAFFMNYKGKTLIGATDVKCTPEEFKEPTEEDLNFLIYEANYYTDNDSKLTKDDVLSVWTGIRPLVRDPSKAQTEKIVRKHLIKIDEDNLVSLTGGKWTIYRLMAEETIDKVIKHFNLTEKRPCLTSQFSILGSQGYTKATELDLALKLNVPEDIAKHLATSYGTKAYLMKEYFDGTYTRLTDGYPYTKQEIYYCMDHEMAYKISDVIFNRFMLGYIDVRRAYDLINVVGEVMKEYFMWSGDQYTNETEECICMLDTCGYSLLK
jgi:glycerol-3-phosphate dehydrogenase